MNSNITLASLFDGISGFPLAGQRNGITAKWASEIEPFPMKVSAIRFPDMVQLGDVTKINGAEVEPVDIITFGSPCTRLSVAGKHDGFEITFTCIADGEEEPHYTNKIRATDKYQYIYEDVCPICGKQLIETNESALFFHALRIIKEMRSRNGANDTIQPRFAIWENVPGAFSSNKGEDFRAVLEETARIADETIVIPGPPKGKWNTVGCIMGDGWSIAWRILDAQYWGVPQRRRRIFLVADFGGQSAPEVLLKREGLSRHLAKSSETREGIATDVERSIDKTVYDNHGNDSRWTGPVKASQPITSTFGMGGNNQPFVVKKAYSICSDASNSIKSSNPHSGIYEANTSRTLDQNGGSPACNQGGIAIVQAIGFSGKNSATMNLCPSEELSPTLRSGAETHVAVLPSIINCQPSGISGTVSSKWAKDTGGPVGDECYNLVIDETAHSLSAQPQMKFREDMDNLVCSVDCRNMYENPEKSGTLQSKENGGQSLNYQNPVRVGYSVRRLTPLECDRLQDYPDNWTLIPGASDSARYKADGNSVAVCCPEYVLEGIVDVMTKGGTP